MKIAVFGTTLHAGVMAALLAEYGNQIYWCTSVTCEENISILSYQDQEVNHYLNKQRKAGFLKESPFSEIPLDIEVYLFCFSPTQIELALKTVEKLSERPIVHPRLMINGSTFGLHGTNQLKQHLPKDEWVYFPDVIQEGNAINSVLNVKHVIVGVESSYAQDTMQELLRPFFRFSYQYLFMPILDAEFTKLSISGMLATRISYMNDLALVAEKLGIDIANVKHGIAADTRIGAAYLSAGVGFGGENFSHDILTLSSTVSGTGAKSRLLEQVWAINEQQKEILFRKLWNYYHCDLSGKTVAIWGASFKENTPSTHNSPIHILLAALWAQGVKVRLHDPQALDEIATTYGDREDLVLCADQYEAAQGAHALCLVTAWKQYWSPDFKQLQQVMQHPLILDGRNIYDPAYVKAKGFAYEGVGRL
ncbi:UDP-glucose/GDP-mannose dehydrogenase family protein [Acinetobacter baumannii]|uniref:nucleotide sugar dehydrogenase n=1 Tax=Acinetobacter baumannii TaxID=470 RepID=UPI00165EDCD2|nr:nucleotide sugar dehydrogenase [Acinetobacter baumannii]MBD0114862.1 UDP-glucose/GDP-mannose dehydrogenase family protein [Acinetobacter baumannii]MBD0187278.1 UDP-glucose/GDP-mannose dehydrogenase family protein [Acinetobacter baumannii]MBV6562810.1 UDP-glucose/GDP-mannose dehydrogenase family protein [Acinetobacter baumannii]HBM1783481.1 UDP-glucose/GDP-mannose dehydrogenase family protein [Acinetobacter baumannii]HBM2025260.1 UDP-glucose/GDP-mannose dehydrogenase family protein [Acinetob